MTSTWRHNRILAENVVRLCTTTKRHQFCSSSNSTRHALPNALTMCVCVCASACVCVCASERKTERMRQNPYLNWWSGWYRVVQQCRRISGETLYLTTHSLLFAAATIVAEINFMSRKYQPYIYYYHDDGRERHKGRTHPCIHVPSLFLSHSLSCLPPQPTVMYTYSGYTVHRHIRSFGALARLAHHK